MPANVINGPVVFDEMGKHFYETGISKGVLFVFNDEQATIGSGSDAPKTNYYNGVAWNGLTGITEKPSGAESTPLYADNIKYLNLLSAEEYGFSIEAYTYPDEFEACDGSAEITEGVVVGQQTRKNFCMAYTTIEGNDEKGDAYNEKIHIAYGCSASPSEKGYKTVNDSPEAITFTWEVNTTPVPVTGLKPTALVTIDKVDLSAAAYTAITNALYGTSTSTPWAPLPDQIKAIVEAAV